jgi:hypothetical protein
MRGQHDAEIVVAHIGREVVPHDAVGALAGLLVDDVGLEDFDQRKSVAITCADVELNRNDLELNRVAIALGIVPAGQRVEAVVDHPQRIAQVFLAALAAREIGEIGGDARVLRGSVVLVERNTLDGECQVFGHDAASLLSFRVPVGGIGMGARRQCASAVTGTRGVPTGILF